MKVLRLAPLFAFFALASTQDLSDFEFTIISPTQGQPVQENSPLTVLVGTNVCFVSLFVAYSLNDSN